jgi:preprotein translocase subunit SecG
MTARGAADFLTRATTILAAVFIVLSIVLAALAAQAGGPRQIDANAAAPAERTSGGQLGPAQPAPAAPGLPAPSSGQPAGPGLPPPSAPAAQGQPANPASQPAAPAKGNQQGSVPLAQ